MSRTKRRTRAALVLAAALALSGASLFTTAPTQTFAADRPRAPSSSAAPAGDIPNYAQWAKSAHADAKAEAFVHWNNEKPPQVPADCARCHSGTGFRDFVGADGSTPLKVDRPHAVGSLIDCSACHNEATRKLSSVVFPSGLEIRGLGAEARCLQCHQGRESTRSVNAAIQKAAAKDDDTVSPQLRFLNIHYFAAGATMYGTLAKVGYEYPGKTYDAKFNHVKGFDTCIGCHDAHTLELKLDACKTCHTNVSRREDLKNIRMLGSMRDYNGNGNTKEGIYYEIDGLRAKLYQAIQAYAREVSKSPIAYDSHAYPYFFADTNGNGRADPEETKVPNSYKGWTARLLKAAYNYQTSTKDPGAFAHGGKYIVELLHDSIESLNQKLAAPIDMKRAARIDAGHFASSTEPFRHWDKEGAVPGACARCHGAEGLVTYLKEGVNVSAPPATSGFACANCHDDPVKNTRHKVAKVKFPSGAVIDTGSPESNLCISCHQGRESTVSVNSAIAGLKPDETSTKLQFLNVHYFAAGATLFGTEAKGAYEYPGKRYAGRNNHAKPNLCTDCHMTHELEVKVEACGSCHDGVKTLADVRRVRKSEIDFDGNGDKTEGIAAEIEGVQKLLLSAIQNYAKRIAGAAIAYDGHTYPYFFTDSNGDGKAGPDEAKFPNRYQAWTPRLLQAAYNYQYVQKDPGAFVHNPKYVLQVMVDSVQNLGAKVAVPGLKRLKRP